MLFTQRAAGRAAGAASLRGRERLLRPAGIVALAAAAASRSIALIWPRAQLRAPAAAQRPARRPRRAGSEDLVAHAGGLQAGVRGAARARRGGRRRSSTSGWRRPRPARRRDRLPRARPLRRLRRDVGPPVDDARAARRRAQRRRALLDRPPRHRAAVLQAGLGGRASIELSPEEDEAVRLALAGERRHRHAARP